MEYGSNYARKNICKMFVVQNEISVLWASQGYHPMGGFLQDRYSDPSTT
jgi:hypothetical protein